MSSLRTFPALLIALSVTLAIPFGSPALAVGEGAAQAPVTITDPLVAQFAACTGRLSAQMEFQWLMSAASSDQTQAQRAAMIDLLEAVTPDDQRRAALHRRLEAKVAHYRLLTRAELSGTGKDAAWAAHQAQRNIRSCLKLMG
ncbi:hypothetical protein [Litorivita sp. NS0012-18]|uniref:hypothetical protein n=1 Tax=Litorivita sp. NS0012-18 TaxID=3127655 RepID=UPI003102D31A